MTDAAPRVFRAPGRVNLIGGQVDYHEGCVVSMAIDRDVRVAVSPRDDGRVVAHSAELAGSVDVAADGRDEPATVRPAWGRAVAGVVRTLNEAGRRPVGATIAVSSTVPIGAGLSSSAAFEIAVALALGDVAEFEPTPIELVLAAQRAEHIATGVPCGIQDQMTSRFGVVDHALAIDCRTLTVEPLPLPPETSVVVIHSGVPRVLEGSPYAKRRAESLAVAKRLGLGTRRSIRCATSPAAGTPSPRSSASGSSPTLYVGATPRLSDRSCSRVTRPPATTWTSRSRSSTRSSKR